jgi:hypothetical protein
VGADCAKALPPIAQTRVTRIKRLSDAAVRTMCPFVRGAQFVRPTRREA